jgi:hypothetical protein
MAFSVSFFPLKFAGLSVTKLDQSSSILSSDEIPRNFFDSGLI